MQLSYSKRGLRGVLSPDEFDHLTDNGKRTEVFVQLTPGSTTQFLILAQEPFPGAFQTQLFSSKPEQKGPKRQFALHRAKWPSVEQLKPFSRENVVAALHPGQLVARGPVGPALAKRVKRHQALVVQNVESEPPQRQEDPMPPSVQDAVRVINLAKLKAGNRMVIAVGPDGFLFVNLMFG